MGRLDGQVAIVTGGGSGIGRETARLLAAEGAHVVVAGRRKPPLNDVVGEIQKAGGKATARQADVSRHVEAGELAHWTLATLGRVDVLVNNAGHSSRARSIRWVDKDEWDGVLDVNLNGVYALTQAVLPSMIERGGGTIVTVSSVAALRPGLIGGAPYGAAKAAVRNLMGHVHTVLRDKGIRATTVMPAEVDTPILENRPLPPDAKARATMMQAEDVARAVLLCVTLPPRTVIEEIVMSPTISRDMSADIAAASRAGAPRDEGPPGGLRVLVRVPSRPARVAGDPGGAAGLRLHRRHRGARSEPRGRPPLDRGRQADAPVPDRHPPPRRGPLQRGQRADDRLDRRARPDRPSERRGLRHRHLQAHHRARGREAPRGAPGMGEGGGAAARGGSHPGAPVPAHRDGPAGARRVRPGPVARRTRARRGRRASLRAGG